MSSVHVMGQVVRCQVQGTVEPLSKVLAASGAHELLSGEPSLEELFLAHFGAAVAVHEAGHAVVALARRPTRSST